MLGNSSRILVVFLLPERTRPRSIIRELFQDLAKSGLRFIPLPFPLFPPYPPRPLYPPIDDDELEDWIRHWEYRWERDWHRYWEYWVHFWPEWEYYWHRYERHLPEILSSLRRLVDKGVIEGVTILSISERLEPDKEYLNILREAPKIFNVLHVNIGRKDQIAERRTDILTLNYPAERDKFYSLLSRFDEARLDLISPQPIPSKPRRYPKPDDVFLGTASPSVVSPDEEFVARFAAYLSKYRKEISRVIHEEAPTAEAKLDLSSCKWKKGANVAVRLHSSHLNIQNPVQQFKWNGTYQILRFDAKVKNNANTNRIILKFDIAVEGLPIMSLRPEIALQQIITKSGQAKRYLFNEEIAPSSAFASYASKDKREVLGRIRSLQIHTGIDVFIDCLSLQPAEKWKDKIREEICKRDIFWLFWSRRAISSKWVDWEWRTALTEKTLQCIEPHPLEPVELAPPPKELEELQFGSMFEWYISNLQEPVFIRTVKAISNSIISGFSFLLGQKSQRA